jgi:hypothetical protein
MAADRPPRSDPAKSQFFLPMAMARSGRIDADIAAADQILTIWTCEATQSSGYGGITLSDLEYGVRTYHDHLCEVLPVVNLEDEQVSGTLAKHNAALLAS